MKSHIPLHIRHFRPVHRSVIRVCGGTLLLAISVTSLHSAPTEKPTDAEINVAVVNHLLYDSSVPTNEIDTVTSDGIVTLSGTAPNILAKERATMVAEAIKSVRSVVNTNVVEPIKRTDEEILSDVEAALQADPVTDIYEVKPTAANGTVALTGTGDSWHDKQLATSVAKGVKGVKLVTNDVTVSSKTTRPYRKIAAEIKSILESDVWVEDALIHTEVKDGKVTLSGSVGSFAEKQRTQSDVWTAGVKAVDDEGLRVEPWAMAGSLRKEIKVANWSDPYADRYPIGVSAMKGTVNLTGKVDSHHEKSQAEDVASGVSGVTAVNNSLISRFERQQRTKAKHLTRKNYYAKQRQIAAGVQTGQSRRRIRGGEGILLR